MKFKQYIIQIHILSIVLAACNSNSTSDKKEVVKDTAQHVDETTLLYHFIEKSGDIINSKSAPFLVGADEVASNLDKYLVLDIRNHSHYVNGHIDGALQVDADSLIDFLDKKVSPSSYEKIVVAGYSGQIAAYNTSLLRLMGYGNVFSLKYGMSGWSRSVTPNKWTTGISNKYAGVLETKENPKGNKSELPAAKTGEDGGYKIMKSRVKTVAKEGFTKAVISVDSVMQYPDNYYIINYWPKEQYLQGHLPGAIQFQPKKSLKKDKSLTNIPKDKPVVVYCYTGQHSACVTAYLRVLGYDAHSLAFGANGFMHSMMQSGIGHTFNPVNDIKDYPLVTGEKPSLKTAIEVKTTKETEKPIATPPKKKKKEAEESSGC